MYSESKMHHPLSETQTQLQEKMTDEVMKNGLKTVSFRLDDVLTVMPFAEKEDLFTFMEAEFAPLNRTKNTFTELRKLAQEAAEKKISLDMNLTLAKIYDNIVKYTNMSKENKAFFMKRECELAVEHTVPRAFGKKLFDCAKERKRRIAIVYNGIYPRETVMAMLKKCGYDSMNVLIMTNELKTPDAAEKNFVDALLAKAKCSPQQLLHIGSDVLDDVEKVIMKGAKALLMQSVDPLMVKSGRFRGYIQSEHAYDYDTDKYTALRNVLGLYRLYGFDVPRNKELRSDFCGDGYMMGFLVLGALRLTDGYEPATPLQEAIADALEKCPETAAGAEDMRMMYDAYFGDAFDNYGTSGCEIPLYFLENFAFGSDREILKPYLSDEMYEKWAEIAKEPELAPVYANKVKKNAVAKLADTLFPPGTKVRTITDGVLAKMKRK